MGLFWSSNNDLCEIILLIQRRHAILIPIDFNIGPFSLKHRQHLIRLTKHLLSVTLENDSLAMAVAHLVILIGVWNPVVVKQLESVWQRFSIVREEFIHEIIKQNDCCAIGVEFLSHNLHIFRITFEAELVEDILKN